MTSSVEEATGTAKAAKLGLRKARKPFKLLSVVKPRCRFEGILYRALMRLAHKHGWHYAPGGPELLPNDSPPGTSWHWCQWCGLRGKTYRPTSHGRFICRESQSSVLPASPTPKE